MVKVLRPLAFAGFAFSMIAAAWSPPALADGSPVVSLAPTLLDRTGSTVNSTVAASVTTARVVGYGPGPDFAPIYDLSAQQVITSHPVAGVQVNGENVDIQYDHEAAARIPHTLPDVSRQDISTRSIFDVMTASGS